MVLPESPEYSAASIQQGIDTIPVSTVYCLTINQQQPTHYLVDVFERRPSGETKTYRQNVTTIDRHGRTFIDTISSAEARDTQRMLGQALQQESKAPGETQVVVDASGLQRFDSSALAVLLECQRLAKAWGKGFVVRQAPEKLSQLARLYGVDSLLMPGSEVTEGEVAA